MVRRFGLGLVVLIALMSAVGTAVGQSGDAEEVNSLIALGTQRLNVGELVLEETFDRSDAWENFSGGDMNLRVEDGTYRAEIGSDGIIWGLNSQTHTDVVMLVDTQQLSADLNNGYGVVCRAAVNNSGDGYYFLISGDGYYSIYASEGDEFVALVDWTSSRAINQGMRDNRLGVVCVQSYLALYANGQLLAELNDTRFGAGYAGLAVAAFGGSQVEIAFDNLQIWEATGGKPGASSTEATTLTEYAGEPGEVMAELVSLELVPEGGSLVFEEDYAFFSGTGSWFTPLGRRSPFPDVVMAGELTFEVGNPDEFEVCLLTTRINTDSEGTATTFVDVGITNTGDLLVQDVPDANVNEGTVELVPLGLSLGEPHHLLVLVVDETLTAFVDGEQAIGNVPVVERPGTYGISLLGAGPNASCEGRNIWVYQVPSLTPGVCTVSAGTTVNLRSGPGTDFDSPGQLAPGRQEIVQGQAIGEDRQVWWQLEDGAWVRDDVVSAAGDCTSVPTVKP